VTFVLPWRLCWALLYFISRSCSFLSKCNGHSQCPGNDIPPGVDFWGASGLKATLEAFNADLSHSLRSGQS
jgi:hypothetical protein